MAKIKYALGILMACCILSSSAFAAKAHFAKRFKEKKSPLPSISQTPPYQLKAPSGWNCICDEAQLPAKVKLLYVGPTTKPFAPSINLALEETDMSQEEYIQVAEDYHKGLPQSSCKKLGTITTALGDAVLFQIERTTQWGTVYFLQAALVKEGKAYVITATSLAEEFPEHCPQFYQAIQSFHLKTPEEKISFASK